MSLLPFSLDLDPLGLNYSNDAASQIPVKLLSPTRSPLGAASVSHSSLLQLFQIFCASFTSMLKIYNMTKQEKALKQVETEIRQKFCFVSGKEHVDELHCEKPFFEVNVAKTFCRPVLETICVSLLGIRFERIV